jgi:hypothetical protein
VTKNFAHLLYNDFKITYEAIKIFLHWFTKVGVFLVWHKSPIFEMDLGRLAPASEVTAHSRRTYLTILERAWSANIGLLCQTRKMPTFPLLFMHIHMSHSGNSALLQSLIFCPCYAIINSGHVFASIVWTQWLDSENNAKSHNLCHNSAAESFSDIVTRNLLYHCSTPFIGQVTKNLS